MQYAANCDLNVNPHAASEEIEETVLRQTNDDDMISWVSPQAQEFKNSRIMNVNIGEDDSGLHTRCQMWVVSCYYSITRLSGDIQSLCRAN